jgi:putative ABC transport system ATP-binding protein
MAVAESHGIQRELTNFLKRHTRARKGYVALGGIDIRDIELRVLRQQVIVLDRPNFMDMTVREYLDLAGRQHSSSRDLEVLRMVGMDRTTARLPDGLDTRVSSTGWPLTIAECMQLKLAAAILAQPRVLVLSQLFDVLPEEVLRRSLDRLQQNSGTTVIYFSGRKRSLGYDAYLYLGHRVQRRYDDFESFSEMLDSEICEGAGSRNLDAGTPLNIA